MTERMLEAKPRRAEAHAPAGSSPSPSRAGSARDRPGTRREIALQLHLSVKTVETHRENIKRKLALDSNLALIRQAMEWRLLK